MVVADRGLQEVVAADLCRGAVNHCGSFHLHCNLSSAKAFLVWIACKVGLAAEMSIEVTRELSNCRISFWNFAVYCNADS